MSEKTTEPPRADIQIVDDNPENLDILAAMINKMGYKARLAINGAIALKSIRSHPPDIILLDILMPIMDGYEVCRRIKSEERTRDIPVIFISGLNDVVDKVKGFSAGGVDYITKPFQPAEVFARLETHLLQREVHKRLEKQNAALQREIIQRERAEGARRERDKQRRTILDGLPDHIRWVDVEMNVQWANIAALASAPDLVGRPCHEIVVDRPTPCGGCPVKKCLETGRVEMGALRRPAKDGRSGDAYWEIIGVPLKDEEGEIEGAIEIARDATERGRAEEELHESRQNMRAIVTSLDDIVFVIDDRFTFLNCWTNNDAMLFLPKDRFLGKTIVEALGEEFGGRFQLAVAEVIQTGERWETEYPSPFDGGEAWYSATITPVRRSGRESRRVSMIIKNITQRKRMEDALRESERKFRSMTNDVLGGSRVGIFILDAEYRIVWVNEAIKNYFGLGKEDVIGADKRRVLRETMMHIFEAPEKFKKTVMATYDDNTYTEKFECHVLPDGDREERWLEHYSHPVLTGIYKGGRIEHYYDISDRKRAEEELRKKNEHLELFNRLSVDRELKMIELKKEINALLEESGKSGRYMIAE